MNTIKLKIWNPSGKNMLYEVENVYDCLKQQIVFDKSQPTCGLTFPYDHCSEGMVFLQCTNLLDKNGKEIYAGDIMDEGTGKHWVVKQLTGGAWALDYANGSGEKFLYPINQDLAIIGNIYQNPELVKPYY